MGEGIAGAGEGASGFSPVPQDGPGVGLAELMVPLGHGRLNKSNSSDHDQL